MDSFGLKDNRVVITGAAGGLGRAFAQSFADSGCQLLIADINTGGLEETKKQLELSGAKVTAIGVDITSGESCQKLAACANDAMGGIDTLINNAALYGGLERRKFADIEESVWDDVMAINVKGVWQMTRAIAPLMQRGKHGSIINIASATVFSGSAQWMHYVASKGAVIAMTRVMAKELGADGIRANVIAPGFTLTEASNELIENAKAYGVDRSSLGRNAEPKDIVGSALYLASEHSAFMTGQTLVVDGGKQFI